MAARAMMGGAAAPSDHEVRLKRLALRASRRGIREMDLLYGSFIAARLAALVPRELNAFEALLGVSDLEVYSWVSGQRVPPRRFDSLIEELRHFAPGAAAQHK